MNSIQQNTQSLLNEYFNFYQQKYSIRELKKASEIITPFTNHLNDRIALYVEFLPDDKLRLSDDGITLNELEMLGIDITSATRTKILNSILKNYQLAISEDVIYTIAESPSQFSQKKLNMIQGLLSVYDILFTSRENSKSIFQEEVFDYFFENDFGGTEQPKLVGASGITHSVDYSLGATKKRPQILFKFLNTPTFTEVAAQKYVSDDLKKGLEKPRIDVKYVIIGNDRKQNIPQKSVEASRDMGIDLIPWSLKEKILQLK